MDETSLNSCEQRIDSRTELKPYIKYRIHSLFIKSFFRCKQNTLLKLSLK